MMSSGGVRKPGSAGNHWPKCEAAGTHSSVRHGEYIGVR